MIKSKTINFAVLLAIFGAVQQYLPLVQDQLKDKYGFITIGIAVIVAILRVVTKKPLSEK